MDEQWESKITKSTNTDSGPETRHAKYQDFFVVHTTCIKLLRVFAVQRSLVCSSDLPRTLKGLVDICDDRMSFCKGVARRLYMEEQQQRLPPGYFYWGSVEHPQLYFGARRFWAYPWNCEAGFEYLCADPIQEPQTQNFISACLAHRQTSIESLFPASLKQLQLGKGPSSGHSIERCPREILDLIIGRLSLRSALNLLSSSRELSVYKDTRFWRSQTLRLHGQWFWELQGYRGSSVGDWFALLQVLTTNRIDNLKGSEPYWHGNSFAKQEKMDSRLEGHAGHIMPSLPLGLKNRQRIWMCLNCMEMKAEWETT